jgi:hypothetical protein
MLQRSTASPTARCPAVRSFSLTYNPFNRYLKISLSSLGHLRSQSATSSRKRLSTCG